MEKGNRSVRLADSRFKSVGKLKKKQVHPSLHWFLKQDYFSNEMLGIKQREIDVLKNCANEAFQLFEKATERVIQNNELAEFNIPEYFHEALIHSWKNKAKNPLLVGRFDINQGLEETTPKVIEFNADTCSTIPETALWQKAQINQLEHLDQFNHLAEGITATATTIKAQTNAETILASSFGYKEDVLNCNVVLQAAAKAPLQPFYTDLEHVVFSPEEGIFYKESKDNYVKIDIWYKLIPWDFILNEEEELGQIISTIILNDYCTILNPAYTALWQNKKFLAYITEHFPNEVIAETFIRRPNFGMFVTKPILGRLGENVNISDLRLTTQGDYANQDIVYQRYHPLYADNEKYYYQLGMFYNNKPLAINLRAEEQQIMTDDCEFMSHYIMD